MQAGGVRVGSGGLEIQSGGLEVDGGIRLRSGTLTIDDTNLHDATNGVEGVETFGLSEGRHARAGGKVGGFEVASGGIRTFSKDTSTPALSATAEAEGFGGAVLSVAAPASVASPSFRLLQGIVAAEDGRSLDTTDNTSGTEQVCFGDSSLALCQAPRGDIFCQPFILPVAKMKHGPCIYRVGESTPVWPGWHECLSDVARFSTTRRSFFPGVVRHTVQSISRVMRRAKI